MKQDDTALTQITDLLNSGALNQQGMQDRLLALVYNQMKQLASQQMRHERPNHTLSPTALVHESFLRLFNQNSINWQSKKHFYGAVAESMRRILVESARAKNTLKRGAGQPHLFNIDIPDKTDSHHDLVALDTALTALEHKDQSMAQVVKLRYFSGLTIEQIAELLEISPRTVNRQWSAARAWLIIQMH
ncbi:MAG: ECF-type sigma factor [Proteobacteria bacterium]|nr:ECF-type sigma factor [Pseudomonadota bacterium]